MAKDRNGKIGNKDLSAGKSKANPKVFDSDYVPREDEVEEKRKSTRHSEKRHKRSSKSKRISRKRYRDDESSDEDSDGSYSSSESDSGSDSESEESSDDSEERRRRRRRDRRRRERDEEIERKKRRKEKDKKRRKKEKNAENRKKLKKEKGKTGAVTNSWGKYGVIKETDMWNKRPEFSAWLTEVKQINLECLPNWEEKQMFKEFMEDHNTATFPSKKYYNLDGYYRRQLEKEIKRGMKKVGKESERIVFNDEEQRRQEMLALREKQKEEQVEELKQSMRSGMAQAMKDQARLKEEMAYQYKIGNFEAAAAIQRRLDPDLPT